MFYLAEKFGLQSSEVLTVSKELDALINQYLTKAQLLKKYANQEERLRIG